MNNVMKLKSVLKSLHEFYEMFATNDIEFKGFYEGQLEAARNETQSVILDLEQKERCSKCGK